MSHLHIAKRLTHTVEGANTKWNKCFEVMISLRVGPSVRIPRVGVCEVFGVYKVYIVS
jgi:hypothetical protein